MKKLLLVVLLTGLAPWVAAQEDEPIYQQPLSARTIKVKIDAPVPDSMLLLSKLNANGKYDKMKFEKVESGYSYRIVFGAYQGIDQMYFKGSGGGFNTSASGAKVFDPDGNELFQFVRANRSTDTGAANAVAKEIIKRIKRLEKLEGKN